MNELFFEKPYLKHQRVAKRKPTSSRLKLGQPRLEKVVVQIDAAVIVALKECARRREMELEDFIAEQMGNVAVDEIPHLCGVTLLDFLLSRRAFVEGD
jgi:hypothetical protein